MAYTRYSIYAVARKNGLNRDGVTGDLALVLVLGCDVLLVPILKILTAKVELVFSKCGIILRPHRARIYQINFSHS